MLNSIVGVLGNGAGAAGDYQSISTVTVGAGGSATVTFSSIPSTYQHLQVRALARCATATVVRNITLRINSDTGANYTTHYLYGDGASALATADISAAYMYAGIAAGASANASVFGANVMDILDYANTSKNTTLRNLRGVDNNGSGTVYLVSGLWNNTAAVSTLTLAVEGGANFSEYSSFALYGIKG